MTKKDKVVKRNDRSESFQGVGVRMGIQPKEEFTEAEKQALSDGTFYEEVTYPDGYSVTRMSSGTKGKNQRYPFIYSKMVAPDGSVLYQQDQYRNYPLINKSPKVIDINDVSYNFGNGEAWFNKYKSIIDGKNLNSPRTKTNRENDLLEYQQGGSIASRLWNKWTGKDKYVDGYGTTRSHVPVRESAHRTALKAADSPMVQAIPVVGDIADGYVAADYAAKGDYKPAIAAIGAGLILPDLLESGARYIPKDTWRDALKKFDDVDLNSNITRELPDDVKKYWDDINSGKIKLTKDISELTDNEKELLLENLQRGSHRIPSQRIDLGPVDHDIDKIWMPENPNIIGKTDIGNIAASKSVEPWWGWDPVEYQQGGEIPSNDQQQQLFVAIITDMAATLGVEPSQEFAEAVLTAFEKQDDSQGLITLFTKTKDKFMNETGLFREGGKMHAFVEKFKCGGKAKKTSKKQMGGEVEDTGAGYITTPVNNRQMRRNWRQATGGTRREARQVQRNLTDYIENKGGISHGGARNAAAAMMGDTQRFAVPVQTPTLKPMDQPQLNVSTPALSAPKDIADMNYDHLGFNQAFGRARGTGADTFTWRGKEYTTELAPEPAAQTRPDLTAPSANGGVYPDYYYNNLAAAGAKMGENFRKRREERRAARQERRENDPAYGHGALIGAETAMGAAVGSGFGPIGTLVGAGIGAGIGAGTSYLARRRAQQNQ